MTATAPDVDQLQHLEWDHQPTCEAEPCVDDHGPATHTFTPLICVCGPLIICTPCADAYMSNEDREWDYAWCRRCKVKVAGGVRQRDCYRVEPLP